MGTGIASLIGLTGGLVLIGTSLKVIEQIDVQGKKIINPSEMKLPKLGL